MVVVFALVEEERGIEVGGNAVRAYGVKEVFVSALFGLEQLIDFDGTVVEEHIPVEGILAVGEVEQFYFVLFGAGDDGVGEGGKEGVDVVVGAEVVVADAIGEADGRGVGAVVGEGAEVESVGSAIVDLEAVSSVVVEQAIGGIDVGVLGEDSRPGGVVDFGVCDVELGRGIGEDADDGIFDFDIFEGVALAEQSDAIPLSGFVFEFGFEAVTLDDDGFVWAALDAQAAMGEYVDEAVVIDEGLALLVLGLGYSSVHIDFCAFRQMQGTGIDEEDAVDDIGPWVVPGDFVGGAVAREQGYATPVEAAGDVVGVLAPGFEQDFLAFARVFETDFSFDDEGADG